MEAMLGQSRRGVNPRSGQVTIQTQPPLAEQETNTTSAPNHLVFLDKAECVRSFRAKLEDDRRGIFITGLAIDKEHMFVVDIENNRTKVFTHEGQFKFDIKVNKPRDVAVSQTGHLYITSYGDRCVQVYSTRGQQVTTMGQGLLGSPRGITLNRQGHVMVCDTGKKSIFTFHADSGQLLNTILLSMCEHPVYITVNSVNDNIVISDMGGHCVHVLSPTGDHLYKYDGSREGSELRSPHGVCTDSYGHIFIADSGNRRIVALSPQGQFIRYIVTKDDGLWSSTAVVINPATGQLVVVEWRGNVKTFQYIELKQGE
ncbi:tripartite motif-containing protein 3-like [Lingula anatina]|uniref:Tripartite motif-containing protein 3-like n=1 Tax=Lingula anatina TaxID=7574 RepID=A0A2R2MNI9_LINAN|nr:tripartite motif-containing protein 3-like [Lingula anatina]XP_023931779.1 tripartite motif-containing protein 3-like [Lingula anatina]XP_023931780.1 tripartite motif-containing protein 3-like [Lingula anatina]XP_023931781.1 tripartite motif-containing protein 3-like [Lingula anatina]|eukprot:XP_023931778.1 tripartite motif-containing protein 3-like [Lingula anatina]